MDIKNKMKKLSDKFLTKYLKLINQMSYQEYFEYFGPHSEKIPCSYSTLVDTRSKDLLDMKSICIVSDLQINKVIRDFTVSTFQNIDYIKKDKYWTIAEKVGFMEEMFRYKFNYMIPDERDSEEYLMDISRRYNIQISKLKSTMAIFIYNIRNGSNSDLLNYFSWYEIFMYNYSDNKEKLLQDFVNRQIK